MKGITTMKIIRNAFAVVAVAIVATVYLAGAAVADQPEMVTFCHAAGQDGTTQFVTLTLPYNAVFGQAGHFNEDGTPAAGHEADYLGECIQPTTTTTEVTPSTTTSTSLPDTTSSTSSPTSTVQESTSTLAPTSTAPGSTSVSPSSSTAPTSTVAVIDPPLPGATTTTPAPTTTGPLALPTTGSNTTGSAFAIGIILLGLGALIVAMTRRPVA